jgi:YD repeat-containing protein
MTDPMIRTTTFSFVDQPTDAPPATNTNAYLTNIQYANGLQKKFKYQYDIGYLTQSTDENSKTTAYSYDDPLFRLTRINYPDGGETDYSYNDSAASVTTSKALTVDQSEITVAQRDGMFHTVQTQLASDPDGPTCVEMSYDGEGKLFTQSNPNRICSLTASGIPTSTFYYDALGRPIKTLKQDGTSTVQTCYDGLASTPAVYCSTSQNGGVLGSRVDSTDERGNHWQRVSDVFGRLTTVFEPNGSTSAAQMETDYVYNALDQLSTVTQKGLSGEGAHSRSFSYDSLARLYSGTNPETGLIGYTYDLNGNLITKTDHRGVQITYAYDTLNRLLSKRYSDGKTPSSCFQYDSSSVANGLGRLSNEWTQSNSAGSCPSTPPSSFWTKRSIISYDTMGRVWNEQQFAPGNSTNGTLPSNFCPNRGAETGLSYCYDLAGNLTFSTNGMNSPSYLSGQSPITFASVFSGAGRLQTVTTNYTNNNTYPASLFSPPTGQESTPCAGTSSPSAQYWPFGGLMNARLGNGITLNRVYDNRLRTSCENDSGSR